MSTTAIVIATNRRQFDDFVDERRKAYQAGRRPSHEYIYATGTSLRSRKAQEVKILPGAEKRPDFLNLIRDAEYSIGSKIDFDKKVKLGEYEVPEALVASLRLEVDLRINN